MSYDVWLEIDTGAGELVVVAEVGNMTSNVAPMWRKALPPDGIAGLDGKRCTDVSSDLVYAVERMERDREEYLPMNPPNGWGNYESALRYLRTLALAAAKHPGCTIKVSR